MNQPRNQEEPSNIVKKDAFAKFITIAHTIQGILKSKPSDEYFTINWVPAPLELTTPRFGATEYLHDDITLILELSQEFLLKHNTLLEPVLWREAYLLYLPRSIRLVPEAADLGLYCYYKFGIKNRRHRQRFRQLWDTVSPAKDHIFYRYYPSVGFEFFDKTVDGTLLKRAIEWLSPFQKLSTPIPSENYTANLERWMFNHHRKLKPIEQRVLQGLNNCPTCTQNELAKQLGIRQPTVSRIIRTLSEKHLLRLITFPNYPVLGLHPIIVAFSTPTITLLHKLRRILVKVRYTEMIQEFNDGLLVLFVIPSRRVQRFRQWVKQLVSVSDLLTPTFHLLIERTSSRNFGLYEPKNKGWPKNYDSILASLSRLVNEDWTEQLPPLRSFKLSRVPVPAIKLQPEDFVYMQRATDAILLTRGPRFSEMQEARLAGYSESEHMAYRRRVDFLRTKNVMSPPLGVGIFNIGLDAVVNLFLQSTHEETRKILTALQLLPYVAGNILDSGALSASILVPKAFAVSIEASLRELLANSVNTVNTAINPAWDAFGWLARFSLISRNYDYDKGSWIWTKNTLPLIHPME